MLRYAYMITCFQEIVNHLIIFWYTFGKTVTDDHHTFRPFRLIKFNMKFRCPSCFALSVFAALSHLSHWERQGVLFNSVGRAFIQQFDKPIFPIRKIGKYFFKTY